MAKILIIDDREVSQLLDRFLKRKGHDTFNVSTGKKALRFLKENYVEIIFCDFRLPDTDGRELLLRIRELNSEVQVVIITDYSDVKTAVDVIKNGAFDYIIKPLLPEEILMLVEKALKLQNENKKPVVEESQDKPENSPHKKLQVGDPNCLVVGESREAEKLQNQIKIVAPTNYSVIIHGDVGTGKESVAYCIHKLSDRKNQPFIEVDCVALTKETGQSELFGHQKGAFANATQTKIGQFELANGGTIFLDEVGDLNYDIQTQLLRFIQERKIRRIGSLTETTIDVRVIVASSEKLNELSARGKFREDLYHRLNEFSFELPKLRDRREDIMIFAKFFLKNANRELNKNVKDFGPDVEKKFLDYSWPGNLREMNNIIKRAVLLTNTDSITLETLPQEVVFPTKFAMAEDNADRSVGAKNLPDLKSAAIHAEYEKILEVLRTVNFNKSKAALILDIDRKTLYNKMKAFNLLLNS